MPAVTVRDGQKDVTVNIAYTANDQITRIIYVDQDGNKVKTDTINGKTDQTVDTNSMVPSGWKIIDGKVPEKVHLTGIPTPDTTITIDHNETAVDHNSPVDPGAKMPTGRDIKGAHENDLNQTITRTINVTAPNGKTATTKQVAKLHRDAVIDDVTGDVTYGKWTEDAWVDFQPGQIAGYTVSQAVVPAFTVKNGQKGQIVNINYVANKQAANVVYKDGDQVVKTIPVGGKTDQTVDLNYVVPEHYTIINQDRLPKDYTFQAASNDDVIVELGHQTKPAADSQTITRTINITDPQSKVTMIKQTATLTRQGTTDKVTGQTEWGNWTTASWDAYNVPEIKGYTASQPSVAEADVTADTKDAMIDISYTANDQSAKIIYKDGSKIVKSAPINGTTAQTISLTYTAPDGYTIADAGKLPKKYTFKADKNADVVVELGHQHGEVSDSKTITRMINIATPDGKTQSIKQTTKLTRHGQKDAVTGDIKWSNWSGGSWDDYKVPEIKGYTASQPSVAEADVTANTKDAVVNIIYTADEQTAHVVYKDGDKVVRTDKLTGKTGETVKLTTDVPANYHVTGKVLTPYTFMADGNKDIVINLLHDTEKVSDSQTITRTINVMVPSGKVTTTKQAVKLNRTGVKDLVTNDTTWGDWTSGNWAEYNVPTVAGYTPTQAAVIKAAVTSETKDITVSITYTANDQITCIIYVDKNDHQIKIDTITGKTAQIVDVHSDVPTGWKIVDGQVPETVHFTGAPTPDTTITVAHDRTTVDHNNPVEPGTKTPTGQDIKGAHQGNLNQMITRTINVTKPDGQITTTTQVAKLHRDAIVDDVTGEVSYGDWTEDTWADFKPGQIAGYTISQADVPAVTVKDGQKAQIVSITYAANEQATHVVYKDGDRVVKNVLVNGETDQTVNLNYATSEYYKIINQDSLPQNYTFKADGNNDVIVELGHQTKPAADIQTIARTINVTDPQGNLTTTHQVARLTRQGTTDLVNNQTTWNEWTSDNWAEFIAPVIAGYTPSWTGVDAAMVKNGQQDVMVNITYTANDQATHIVYTDQDGHQVKIDMITGKTAQTVDVHSDVPTGWKIVDGQVPATVHFTGDQTPDMTITVDHRHHIIDGQGELPTGLAPSAFTKTVTRTINVRQPDGTVKTTKQTATFNRIADVDGVTQQVTFGDWQLTSNGWVAFTTPAIDHYTPSQAMVEAVDDAASLTRDVTVDIAYTANRGTVEIKYVDKDGNEIGYQMITSHVGDTVKVTPQFPTNWVPMDPATVPTAVRIKEENGQIIIVVIRHAVNDPAQTKTVTRTIRVTTPDGQTTTTSQVAKISRYGDLDLVTGQIAWNPWTTARWDAFKPATIVGYTPSQAELPVVTVDGETADQTVAITYAAVAMPPPTNAAHQAATATTHHLTATTSAQVAVAAKQTPAAQSAAPAATNRQRLPQTGNGHDASTLAGLASLLGLFGLAGKRRKRD